MLLVNKNAMKYQLQIITFILLLSHNSWSEEPRQTHWQQASITYQKNDFLKTIHILNTTPGLVGVAPIFDHPKKEMRSRIYFDLGRCYLALHDTTMAQASLKHSFFLKPTISQGVLNVPDDSLHTQTRKYIARLKTQHQRQKYATRSAWQAAHRSFVFPGWGQMYRGHKKRGLLLMGTSIGLGMAWFVADRSYHSARKTYQNTQIEDANLKNRSQAEATQYPFGIFDQRYERVQSRARRAKWLMGAFAVLWGWNIADNFIVTPKSAHIVLPLN